MSVLRMEWKETARWIKFEEDVEEGGNKWSKPHVATLSLHSLFELRRCLLKGTVLLDMQADNLTHISGESVQCVFVWQQVHHCVCVGGGFSQPHFDLLHL